MHPLLAAENARLLLLGNEAVVRGALEAGVGLVAAYPGTPSSEITDAFAALHGDAGVHFEYSINEKVALEVAGAAAAAGVRSLAVMKHVGVNVAADPLMTLAYTGVRGGLVLISADDPGCHSSQNEQDNRYYARLGKLPLFEPEGPEDAYLLTLAAFALSEKYQTPVILRTTTRVAHTRRPVVVGKLGERRNTAVFVSDKRRFTPVPAVARLRHPVVEATLQQIEAEFDESPLNRETGAGRFGILTSGVAACYVEDAIARLGAADRVRVLRLATTHPVPRRRLAEFAAAVDRALVAEELDPLLETELRLAGLRAGKLVPVFGKESGHFSPIGEFDPDRVTAVLAELLQIPYEPAAPPVAAEPLPGRPPVLCPGCPHRATYYAVKLALGDAPLYLSDIGCYTLGFLPPLDIGDFFICMGSSASSSGGFAATGERPVVAFIGDSTFFHSGMTGLLNSVRHQRDFLLVVLDNGTTGMTGHQPHPGVPEPHKTAAEIADVVRAAGVAHVATIDPADFKASRLTIERLAKLDGPKVLISRSPCPLFAKKTHGRPAAPQKFAVDESKCLYCGRQANGLQCELQPHRDYALARARAHVAGGPDSLAQYELDAPAKMEHPPCEAACPLGLCVQGYVERVAAGQLAEARALIRQRLVLPHAVCRVCHHPCEAACIRRDVDEPVAINALKRFAMDGETDADRAAYVSRLCGMIRENGKKAAIVGAGPAGLACAFDLRLRGYEPHVFEAEGRAGGLCAFGIPAYRLPPGALQKDLDVIAGVGVTFHFGQRLGVDFDLEKLKRDGFAAVFLGPGLPVGARLGVAGEDLPGVVDALSFLRGVSRGAAERVTGDVAVVGGGNSAIDAARCALRLGASSATILYRRTRAEMPAIAAEIAAAEREGVRLVELGAPEGIRAAGGRLAVTCRRMRLGAPDASGRPRPEPTAETFLVNCDRVIAAVGQLAAFAAGALGEVTPDRWGRLPADKETGATGVPFVFAGGDAVGGPASVVEALQAGKYAAYGIDRALADDPQKVVVEAWRDRETWLTEPRYRPADATQVARGEAPSVTPGEAARSFAEAEGAFDAAAARAEARRCLACGRCATCNNCLDNFGCPAFYRRDGRVQIDPLLCDGCGVCVQVCPNGAIVRTGEAAS
jgi:indolepyruvate ferredoxin oxidoreductase alpha subunit